MHGVGSFLNSFLKMATILIRVNINKYLINKFIYGLTHLHVFSLKSKSFGSLLIGSLLIGSLLGYIITVMLLFIL